MERFSLCSDTGLHLEGITLGATLTSLTVPVDGAARQVLLGCPDEKYARQQVWLGAVAGRFANRIGDATLERHGERWSLDANQPPHCLHGGAQGFHRREWTIAGQERDRVRLTLLSPDAEQGFPGNLAVSLEYRLEGNTLLIAFEATSDRATPVSLTSHAYFNLDGGGDVRHHRLTLKADRYLPTRPDGIPTVPTGVEGVFDLRQGRRLLDGWGSHPQQRQAKGYDHAYLLTPREDWHARLLSGDGRLAMELWSDQPSLQLYTGNWLTGTPGREGEYRDHEGICLEAQQVPDSPNRPELGNPWIEAGGIYRHHTRLRFLPTP